MWLKGFVYDVMSCCCLVDVDSWQSEADWVDRWTEQWFDWCHHSPAPTQWPRAWSGCNWG